MEPHDDLQVFRDLAAVHRPRKDDFYRRSEEQRRLLFDAIKRARNNLLDEVFARVSEARAESAPLADVRRKTFAYFDRSDWALLDLVALASCTDCAADHVAAAVAPNALAYHSLRMLDDVLDGHLTYKGGLQTLFGELTAAEGPGAASQANLLIAMMIVASTSLEAGDRTLLERTLIGMLHEAFPGDTQTPESYERIALAKMGAYGLFLYRPVLALFPSAVRPPLERFLTRSFVVSQFMNDLQDRADDEARRQPNYWTMQPAPDASMAALGSELAALASCCLEIPRPARDYTHARITDLAAYLLQIVERNDQSRRRRDLQAT